MSQNKIRLKEPDVLVISRGEPDGKRCIKKVVHVKETVYDRGVECHHKLKKKCHLTYVTDYHSAPEEKCETNFKKKCHITFTQEPHTEKVKKCHTPFEKKCGPGHKGKEICKTIYENICETKYEEYDLDEDKPVCKVIEEERCKTKDVELLHIPHHPGDRPYAKKEVCEKWPVKKCDIEKVHSKKIHPKTDCKKVPRKVCHPTDCEMVPGKEICYEDEVTKLQAVPHEECDLEPHKDCKTESTLVPKEICVDTKKNPKHIVKPIYKNWCYDPRELHKLD
ncbi:Uncharacterized protein FKW44_019857 [Caligus rogercresseyi]|uniref:Uncharacterized protein n=1 Tax=Caligus rogercresseyi TaxID=217165 RepID=A0A7T8GWF4_CALRO|nr:Uncharacterized protein FKW44_019857 [Caligus rogercresseyi]